MSPCETTWRGGEHILRRATPRHAMPACREGKSWIADELHCDPEISVPIRNILFLFDDNWSNDQIKWYHYSLLALDHLEMEWYKVVWSYVMPPCVLPAAEEYRASQGIYLHSLGS